MTIRETIAKLIQSGHVSECFVQWESTVKPAAAHKARKLTKIVTGHYDVGREYVPKDVDGSPKESADPRSLPWGEWDAYPYLIRHNDREYLRLLPPVDGNSASVSYFVDGQSVSKEEFQQFLTPGEVKKMSKPSDCFSVTIDKLTRFKESKQHNAKA